MEENNKSLMAFSDNIQIGNDISDEDRILIEAKLWKLLGKRTERYTMGDSTSIPVEIAEELLNSIFFSLELELRELTNVSEVLIEKDINDLLEASWNKITSLIDEGKNLLELVKKSSTDVENISYNDTLNEIGKFFYKYNYRFFAHKIDCSIDYQLSNPISEKFQGIEYINEYLKALLIENEFCRCFDKDNISYILNRQSSDYKELLINIFDPILTNSIGLNILGEDILKLEITPLQRETLLEIFRKLSKPETLAGLKNSVRRICDILGIVDNENIEYIQKSAMDIYPRIEVGVSTANIDNVFLSFKYEDDLKESRFIDNDTMDDERLRDLIDEINDCRFICDKIAMVKEAVHSLSDLLEVLSICFWEDEVLELFKELSVEEIYIIKNHLDSKVEAHNSESGWEIKFKQYINSFKVP
ncbi:DUF6179 domain-containing protein [Clostridium cellulovorans]|uniref:Uncharacterized protein n=1 Tax=Clostridium cellulovorans (strain ATCC 35296 / DSM 3052 / OCM 3 / 743B) TaxID=573061 RepID=D9SWP6_CLOC7|nr:DUF6179 domain-containing protein [Clostridium cellulovorans]ADL53328.1 hypothetical protein Clocel_3658 [Clostridium cellulovorans 743B]